MAETAGSLKYDLILDKSRFDQGLSGAQRQMQGFSGRLSKGFGAIAKVAKVAAVGVAAAGTAATAFGITSVKAYSESQDTLAQLNAVIKSTKGVAGVTAKSVTRMADSLQKVTKFGDEAIIGGQNILLTFTNIGKDVFPQATETMLDMSQALGQDLKASSIQLGKALQDPIKGVTALRKVGVNFTEAQQEQIKALVDSGKAAEAQKLILKELQVEFGGSAKAAGKTFSGQLAILKNRFGEVQESVGKLLVHALTPFVSKLADVVAKIDWDAVIKRTVTALGNMWRAVSDVARQVAEYLMPKIKDLWYEIQTNLLPALKDFWQGVGKPLAQFLGTTLVVALGLVIDALAFFARNARVLIPILAGLGAMLVSNRVLGSIKLITTAVAGRGGVTASLKTLAAFIKSSALISPWGLIAGAAIAAAVAIIMKWRQTKGVLEDTRRALLNSAKAAEDAMNRMNRAVKAGRATQAEADRLQRSIQAGADSVRQTANDWTYLLGIFKGTGGMGTPVAPTNDNLQRILQSRASGGPISAGKPYMVGEEGMEMVVPRRGGYVIPNDMLAGAGGITNVNIGTINDRADADYLLRRMDRNLRLERRGLSPA